MSLTNWEFDPPCFSTGDWRHARGELAFPGAGKQALSEEQQQIRQLQTQLREAEMDREILKKALAIFSQTP